MLKAITVFLTLSAFNASARSETELANPPDTPIAVKSFALPKYFGSLHRTTENLHLKKEQVDISFFTTKDSVIKFINESSLRMIFDDISIPSVEIKSGHMFSIPCEGELGNNGIQMLEGDESYYTAERVKCGDVIYVYHTERRQ